MLGGAAGFVEGGGLRGSLGASGRVYYAYANGEIAPGPRSSETLDQTAQELEREYDGDLSQRNLRSVVIGSGRFYASGHRPVSPGASGGVRRGGRTANAPVLKTGVRKDMRVRIPPPPLDLQHRPESPRGRLDQFWTNEPRKSHAPSSRPGGSPPCRPLGICGVNGLEWLCTRRSFGRCASQLRGRTRTDSWLPALTVLAYRLRQHRQSTGQGRARSA